jgi:pimeloyl-ACP methyl ester carboxylesterase
MTTVQRPDRRLRVVDADPLDEVRSSFVRLAERFRPEEARGLEATWAIEIRGRTPMSFHVREGRCLVSPGQPEAPVARLFTDEETWLALVAGRQDGVAAFLAGRLRIEGDLNLAARFETMFRPGPEASRLLRTLETQVRGVRLESIVSGTGTPVILLHGLGANKVSFLPTLDGLSERFEVHALDLPGFGKSGKPLPTGRRYTMPWMADAVHGYLVRNGIRDAHVVGNSMGGRIAIELGLRHPRSVRSIVGLGAAVAFDEYQRFGPLLRFTRPHWVGAAPLPMRRAWVEAGLREMFHDPSRIPADNYRAAADDVLATFRDPGYRLALLACARHLGAERAGGRRSYWTRLGRLEVPSYWIFGRRDKLVHHRYAEKVRSSLPAATVEMWDDVGHVPQFELPDRTNEAITSWLDRIEVGR